MLIISPCGGSSCVVVRGPPPPFPPRAGTRQGTGRAREAAKARAVAAAARAEEVREAAPRREERQESRRAEREGRAARIAQLASKHGLHLQDDLQVVAGAELQQAWRWELRPKGQREQLVYSATAGQTSKGNWRCAQPCLSRPAGAVLCMLAGGGGRASNRVLRRDDRDARGVQRAE